MILTRNFMIVLSDGYYGQLSPDFPFIRRIHLSNAPCRGQGATNPSARQVLNFLRVSSKMPRCLNKPLLGDARLRVDDDDDDGEPMDDGSPDGGLWAPEAHALSYPAPRPTGRAAWGADRRSSLGCGRRSLTTAH